MGQKVDSGNATAEAKPTVVRYTINPRASRFTVRVFAKGVLSAFGHNPTIAIHDFSGEAQIDSEKLEASRLRLTIAASSLAVMDDISDKDRREIERQMLEDVLDVTAYPQIVYACSKVSAEQRLKGRPRCGWNTLPAEGWRLRHIHFHSPATGHCSPASFAAEGSASKTGYSRDRTGGRMPFPLTMEGSAWDKRPWRP